MKPLCSSPSLLPLQPLPSALRLRFANCHSSQPYMAPAPERVPVRLTSDLPRARAAPSSTFGVAFGSSRAETSSSSAGPELQPGTPDLPLGRHQPRRAGQLSVPKPPPRADVGTDPGAGAMLLQVWGCSRGRGPPRSHRAARGQHRPPQGRTRKPRACPGSCSRKNSHFTPGQAARAQKIAQQLTHHLQKKLLCERKGRQGLRMELAASGQLWQGEEGKASSLLRGTREGWPRAPAPRGPTPQQPPQMGKRAKRPAARSAAMI